MTPFMTAFDEYLQTIIELQTRMIESQRAKLTQAAEKMSETTRTDGQIFLFGTGHSHLLAEEGFYRAGGLANVVPILSEHFMLHHLPELGSRFERTAGLADMILDRYAPRAGEMLFVFSNSGVNQLPVEMALRGRERGMFVVSISSFAYAQQASLSELGMRLDQSVNLALDNGGLPGDALLELSDFPWRVAPSSTVIGALLWNGLVAETTRLLLESGTQQPPIYVSINVKGAVEHNQGPPGKMASTQHSFMKTIPSSSQSFAIGIDIGATKIASVLLSETGDLIKSSQVYTLPQEGRQAVFDKVADQILELAQQCPGDLAGVGIGSPGQVDSNRGVVYNAVNLGWTEVNLAEEITDRMDRLGKAVPVWIQKDANLNALGEYYFGACPNCHDFVYLGLGSGLGAGIISHDRLITGGDWYAADVGHLSIDPDGPICVCGGRGCAETVVSGPGLIRVT